MSSFKRSKCVWIYDPLAGDPVGDIEPATPFDKLPADWTCPICGAPQTRFRPI